MLQTPTHSSRTFAFQPGHFFRGCIRQMQRDPLGFYTRTWQTHGDYVRLRIVRGIDGYLLTHPDAVEHVLHKGHRNYRKPDVFYNTVGLLVGDGLFTNEGQSWANQRKAVQPAFHPAHLAKLCPGIVASAEAFVDSQRNSAGAPLDIASAMMKLGLRIASTTLFSTDISGDADTVGVAFRIGFNHISDRMNSLQLIPGWLPTPANRRFNTARQKLDDVVEKIITSRAALTDQPDDLLGAMLQARMPRRMLMDEVITLLTAGHENIGAALSWTWYLLATHRQVQDQLHEQISGVLRGRLPVFEDIAQMPMLAAVFEESMRLYPPAWGELRETIEADNICGYEVPARSMVILCQWVTHRHPEFWPDPDQFDPSRFLNPTGRQRFAYFPFGGGPRICIGMQLAMIEAALVIATILQAFEIRCARDQTVEPDATFTLRPRFGLKVMLRSRHSSPPSLHSDCK